MQYCCCWYWVRPGVALLFFLHAFLYTILTLGPNDFLSQLDIAPALSDESGNPNELAQHLQSIVAENGYGSDPADGIDNNKTIVIVGAGAAGLSAAYTLKYLGVENVILLEASDHWGGRVLESTEISDQVPLDVGAELLGYDPDMLRRLLLFDIDDLSPLLPETIEYRPMTYKTAWYNSNWLNSFLVDTKFKNTTYYGYLRDFFYPYVADGLRTNSVVDTIDYFDNSSSPDPHDTNETKKIQVVIRGTDDDNGRSRTLNADRVVVTVAASVLQNRAISFVPPLPVEKLDVIDSITFAKALKVWLVFDEKFYADTTFPGGLWQGTFRDKLYYDALLGKGLGEDENILAFIAVGNPARDLVDLSDDEIVSKLLEQLDSLYDGQATEHYTGKCFVLNWSKQPFVEGAYLYNAGVILDDTPTLTEPLEERIYFAGEHLAVGDTSTVAGAIMTGRRAAIRLVEDLEDSTTPSTTTSS